MDSLGLGKTPATLCFFCVTKDADPFLEFYKRRCSQSSKYLTETFGLTVCSVPIHLLPSFAQPKYTGLLPRRHATVFAGFLPELSELALLVGKLVSHAARRGRRSTNWRNWWFLEPTRQFELSFVPA